MTRTGRIALVAIALAFLGVCLVALSFAGAEGLVQAILIMGFSAEMTSPIIVLILLAWFFRKKRLAFATFVGALAVMAVTVPWAWYQTFIDNPCDPASLYLAILFLHSVAVILAAALACVFQLLLAPFNRPAAPN